MPKLTTVTDEARIAIDNLADLAGNLVSPSIRLGVTGLSRAGKTVFITSFVHNMLHGGRLPLFEPYHTGRIAGAELMPQPSMDVPRFEYEKHLRTILEERQWPQSTRAISELRLTIRYESASTWNRAFGSGTLNVDIVDYPGEWLLDLPLLAMDFAQWSRQAIALARLGNRKQLSAKWLNIAKKTDPDQVADETQVRELAAAFTEYLQECRKDRTALSTLPPGRFLMPGDLQGSPALTFAPLEIEPEKPVKKDSLHAMMAERYEAYKQVVVKPFFRDHFARLDRQIVLVDALQAINAGPEALADLETALTEILQCFRPGRASWLAPLIGRRIERILLAATKADHLHHENHRALEALLDRLVANAVKRARFAGADVDVTAMAAIRATSEAILHAGKEDLPVITGIPMAGEKIGRERFDGETETAVFPGDLPHDPQSLFGSSNGKAAFPELQFVRFRPPGLEHDEKGLTLSLPHIRLDRALQFLLADKLA